MTDEERACEHDNCARPYPCMECFEEDHPGQESAFRSLPCERHSWHRPCKRCGVPLTDHKASMRCPDGGEMAR